jgi:hypothetical protein
MTDGNLFLGLLFSGSVAFESTTSSTTSYQVSIRLDGTEIANSGSITSGVVASTYVPLAYRNSTGDFTAHIISDDDITFQTLRWHLSKYLQPNYLVPGVTYNAYYTSTALSYTPDDTDDADDTDDTDNTSSTSSTNYTDCQTSIERLINTPSFFVSSDISSSYVNSPNGATINIVVNPSLTGLTFTYSLDGTNFQSSSIFTGITEGDYTITVIDQLGCSASVLITIPPFSDGGIGERTPYADLPSKSNSIRYAKYVDWGICSDYKNDENTLSWQLPYVENACEYKQLFQTCDTITTQIKSNYSNIVATIIDEELVETNAPVTQKTFYTNLRDKRDARIYNVGDGLTGIYFLSGDLYDFYTGVDIGDYNLNGALPAWGVIGNYIFYNNAWLIISNIIYDDSLAAYVLIINTPYTGSDLPIIVSSIYNLEPYNIFEFDVDMSLFQDKKIQVNITQTDDDVSFPQVVFLSEIIDVATVHKGTVCIDYYNDNNTDIFYATGIRNKIRMPIEYFGGTVIDETTSERTDINTYLISAEGYESDTIAFKLMPKEMMRKVVQALSHKFVFLNEVQYVKEESPEVTGLIGTDLYRMNAPMTKSNAVYTSRGTGEVFSTGTFEIPALLKTNSEGFLKIKKTI